MFIFDTGADDSNFGRMVCHWEEDAALLFVRGFAERLLRGFMEVLRPTEADAQKELDELSAKALAMFEEYAPEVFYAAQGRLVFDVVLKVAWEVAQGMQIEFATEGTVASMAEILGEEMQPFRDLRKEMSEFFKTRHNEIIGVKRGRQVGKKDTKPRAPRAESAGRKAKILAAMQEIGQEPVYRKDVAQKIGVSVRTLGQWVSREEWENLIAEALSIGRQK
jgi:hypothetical protein